MAYIREANVAGSGKKTTTSTSSNATNQKVANIIQQYTGVSSAAANNIANSVANSTPKASTPTYTPPASTPTYTPPSTPTYTPPSTSSTPKTTNTNVLPTAVKQSDANLYGDHIGSAVINNDTQIRGNVLQDSINKLNADKGVGLTQTAVDRGYTNPYATPTYNSNNSGAGVSAALSQSQNYYDDLMKAFMERNDAQRQAAIDAILANLDSVKGTYKNRIQKVVDEYQQLINENEVNRERTRRMVRESQANRGQLNSGLGRQERLNLDATYDTNQANLNSARQNAVNEIYNLIAQAESEAKQNKAQVENNYANALLQWQLANQ